MNIILYVMLLMSNCVYIIPIHLHVRVYVYSTLVCVVKLNCMCTMNYLLTWCSNIQLHVLYTCVSPCSKFKVEIDSLWINIRV